MSQMHQPSFTCAVCGHFATSDGCHYCETLARQSKASYKRLCQLRQAVLDGALTDWSQDLAGMVFSSNHRTGMLTWPHWRAPYILQFLRICGEAERRGFAWGAGKHRGLPFYLTHDDFPDVFRRAFPPQDESAA